MPGERNGLSVEDLTVARGDRVVLRDVSFSAPKGAVTVLVGGSGSGKSTLLRCLNRLLEPRAGTVLLDRRDIDTIEARELRRRVGLALQVPIMLPGSVRENLAYGLDGGGSQERLLRALDAAGLDASFLDRPALELSGGERARVALARVLTRGPEMLLLDEPTGALDAGTAAHLAATIERLASQEGLGVVVATHDLALARRIADQALVLRDGRLLAGAPEELLT